MFGSARRFQHEKNSDRTRRVVNHRNSCVSDVEHCGCRISWLGQGRFSLWRWLGSSRLGLQGLGQARLGLRRMGKFSLWRRLATWCGCCWGLCRGCTNSMDRLWPVSIRALRLLLRNFARFPIRAHLCTRLRIRVRLRLLKAQSIAFRSMTFMSGIAGSCGNFYTAIAAEVSCVRAAWLPPLRCERCDEPIACAKTNFVRQQSCAPF